MSRPTQWWWIRHAPVTAVAGRLYGQVDVDCDTGDDHHFINFTLLPKTVNNHPQTVKITFQHGILQCRLEKVIYLCGSLCSILLKLTAVQP